MIINYLLSNFCAVNSIRFRVNNVTLLFVIGGRNYFTTITYEDVTMYYNHDQTSVTRFSINREGNI